MKIRSILLPLISSGLLGLSASSLAVPLTTKLVQIAGLTFIMSSNSPLIEAVRGQNEPSMDSNLRKLKKKDKCNPTTSGQQIACDDFCTSTIPTGTELKSCTDSVAVNLHTCTYEEINSGASCTSCPTDDETGLFFERKKIYSGNPCSITCEYSDPNNEGLGPNSGEDCASFCLDKNEYTNLSLTDCSLEDKGASGKFLVCEYEGVKKPGSWCGTCPTDDDVGSGYWFKSKSSAADGALCQTTCRYINDGI